MTGVQAIRPGDGPIDPVSEAWVREILRDHDVTEQVAVVGVRGYVDGFAGAAGKNLLGVYDDALCIVSRDRVQTYLGNTDPTRLIAQRAVLQEGKYRYQRGIHGITREKEKQYPAWVQAGGVTIRRYQPDGTFGEVLTNQWIGCNIHSGSWTTTGSAACQTVVPEKWAEFDSLLDRLLREAQQEKYWYVLVKKPGET